MIEFGWTAEQASVNRQWERRIDAAAAAASWANALQ